MHLFLNKEQVWHLAITWVRSNNVLIRYIASRYYPFMSSNSEDIEAEALLCAYQTISILSRKHKSLKLTSSYFKKVFTQRCCELSKGVPLVSCDIDYLNIANKESAIDMSEEDGTVREALSVLTRRQREVAEWTLNQQTPATQIMIANHFNVTVHAVRKIINNAIKRLETSGYTRLCKSIATPS